MADSDTKVVAITINKGGVGKTQITRSVGVAAAGAGLAVVILDMDTQQNSTSWRKRRPKEMVLPLVQFTTENDLPETICRLKVGGCDLVLIDTPPGRNTEAPAAVEAADLVLIPCTSETECLEGLPRTARLCRTLGKRGIVVPNFVHPSGKAEDAQIRGVAEGNKLELSPMSLHEFQVHRDGSFHGKTAQELEPNGKASKEINALWEWLSNELHLGTSARVHKRA
ncbi:ParA family protein [Acidisphaera sp. L21]|uniref:ParA family protein n=1 Tax=Acidisphaera sp. L21 TaxID=1641851 RepID=UPI00131DF146|nr:ParA family protein [Acidisphaera sp. L21]